MAESGSSVFESGSPKSIPSFVTPIQGARGGRLTSFGAVISGVKAGVVGGLVDMNPGSSRDTTRIHTVVERESGFKAQSTVLGQGYLFCEINCRAKVRILADYDSCFVPLLVSRPHQVQSQADINALFLTAEVYATAIYIPPFRKYRILFTQKPCQRAWSGPEAGSGTPV